MKNKNLLIGLACLLTVVAVLSMSTKSQKPEETPLFEPILIGTGGDPHWSPDGTKLAYVYNNALYIANADGRGERLKVADLPKSTQGFIWVDSTEFILWEYERRRIEGKGWEKSKRIKSLKIDGTMESILEAETSKGDFYISSPIVLNDGTVGYYGAPISEGKVLEEQKTFRIIKPGKLAPDSALEQMRATTSGHGSILSGDLQLESVDGAVRKRITSGKSYSFPVLSPDGTKILANLYVVDLDGNETRVAELGVDSADISESPMGGTWSPDSRKIAYTRSMVRILDQDGQIMKTLASEIRIVNADGTGRQVIDIPDMLEANPVWSPDGTRIAFIDGKTSQTYVIRIK